MRRLEVVYCSVLLIVSAIASLGMAGAPVVGPISGIAIISFLAILATSREAALKMRYALAFVFFLVAASVSRGSVSSVTVAVSAAAFFLSWTEGMAAPRRFAVKRGEPLPPDGRKGIYSVAFVGSILVAYFLLSPGHVRFGVTWRGILAFLAVISGFCLLDIGYVTRLQAAKRFRRPPVPGRVRLVRAGLLTGAFGLLFLFFGRGLPAAAVSIQEAAKALRHGKLPWEFDALDDLEFADSPFGGNRGGGAWFNPSLATSRGDSGEDPTLVLSLKVPYPQQNNALRKGRVYLRGYASSRYEGNEWVRPDQSKTVTRSDLGDGKADGRIEVSDHGGGTEPILHTVRMLEPYYDGLPALQGVRAFRMDMLVEKPGDWFAELGAPKLEFSAESVPSLFSQLDQRNLQAGATPLSNFEVPKSTVYKMTAELIDGIEQLPVRERIEGIQELLESRCEFSHAVDNFAQPGDELENFLFIEKKGLCIHFATAGTLLLRQAKLPSRIAFGFSGGEYYKDKRVFAFRVSDAHAWTEVYLKGHGWTVVDFSPDGAGAAHPPVVYDTAPLDYLKKAGELAEQVEEQERPEGEGSTPWWRKLKELPWGAVTVVFLCLLILYAIISAWRQRSGEKESRGEVEKVGAPVAEPAYLKELYAMCHRQFGVVKLRQETLREFLEGLGRSGALHGEFDAMARYHYAISYEG